MISKIGGLILIFSVSLLSGCVQPQPLYNYSDYNESYYHYKKDMSEESTLKLQKSIEEAIDKAGESRSGRVPPGMYANLGYIYLKGGNPKGAVLNFEKEKTTYPESAHFMDRIIAKVELAEGASK
jgi:hypothetical protein